MRSEKLDSGASRPNRESFSVSLRYTGCFRIVRRKTLSTRVAPIRAAPLSLRSVVSSTQSLSKSVPETVLLLSSFSPFIQAGDDMARASLMSDQGNDDNQRREDDYSDEEAVRRQDAV